MTTHNTLKRLSFIACGSLLSLMVFGIGINYSLAATPAANTAQLQPASGAAEYAAEEAHDTETVNTTESEAAGNAEHAEDTGIVGMFGLDWKLFLAQLINFGIILFVLWKWVFGPVTKGLSDRTAKIEGSLAEAQRITEERETFDTWKQGEIGKVRAEATAIISEAKQSAEKLKTDTVAQTKDEQNKIIASTQVKLEQEKQAMLESAKNELADLVVSATESILKQKLDPKKDATLIDQALKEAKSKGNTERTSA